MLAVPLRNLDIEGAAPVESRLFEAVTTAIERGTVSDWARLAAAIAAEPWGHVARQVEEPSTALVVRMANLVEGIESANSSRRVARRRW